MFKVAILLVLLLATAFAEAPPKNIGFEEGDEGFDVIAHRKNGKVSWGVGPLGAKPPSEQGLVVNVIKDNGDPEAIQVRSPKYTLEAGQRYLFKASIKTMPKDERRFSLSIIDPFDEVVATKKFESTKKWKKYTLAFMNVMEADYIFSIGVGGAKATYLIDDIDIVKSMRKEGQVTSPMGTRKLGKGSKGTVQLLEGK